MTVDAIRKSISGWKPVTQEPPWTRPENRDRRRDMSDREARIILTEKRLREKGEKP